MRASEFLSEEIKFKIDPMYQYYYDEHDNQHDSKLVSVDVKKLDKLWANNPSFYIGKHGQGQIKTRYQDFGKFLDSNPPYINAPHVSVSDGDVMFGNGRHRFAWFRDHGYKTIPVSMDKDSIKNAKLLGLL